MNDGAIQGMTASAANAERVSPGWGDDALEYLREFVSVAQLCGVRRFVAPDVRHWAYATGLEVPPSNRAWGGVLARAGRLGVIRRCGFRQYGDETMNTQAVIEWEVPT
jgi:hypothetical protein